ncbi:hypothetical protein [Leptospira barantonii]|uniref:Outer membrane protein beta-barrel domain-containing protein n=1 Tax=Leptospira barantonii TaxID=2023184 RepID=A0ABX4NKY6_9LEPT|nr:hypothetical protein [Leptospira barantonii]PJZ57481.1 hypothetical protein CH367_09005 [Leptospira barantonii]
MISILSFHTPVRKFFFVRLGRVGIGIKEAFFATILSFFFSSSSIFGNTLLLKDGRKIENVKTSLREDHVLVEDVNGNVEKLDLTLVEKILIAEIKIPEIQQEFKTTEPEKQVNIKKFYYSLNAGEWNSHVTEGMSFNRGYNAVDIVATTIYIDPYLGRNYSVRVKTISLIGEYRRNQNLGFTLGLEQNSFSFPNRGISPFMGIFANTTLNALPEYQGLAGFSTISILLDSHFGGYKNGKRGSDAFTIGTLSVLPGIKYYVSLMDSLFWFVQAGIGFGRSYDSGIYSAALTQTAVFAGTGLQWESDSYFVNAAVQYRKTDLIGSVHSYNFQEPSFTFGIGIKR